MSWKQRRQGVRMCVKREMDKISQFINGENPIDTKRIQLSVTKLSSYKDSLENFDVSVLSEITDETDIENEIRETADYNDGLLENIAQGKILLESSLKDYFHTKGELSTPKRNLSFSSQKIHLRLPKLEIRPFSGDPLDFQSFWDAFESSVHNNDVLSPVEKFSYLKGLLSGDALKAIDGYRLTSANYEAVVETLQERFGDKQLAIFGHFEAMLALPPANYEVSNLQSISDDCERHIRSLVALGLDESTFGQVFTPIMLSKLPKYVKIELHRRNGSQAWSLHHLREWLKAEIKAREMGERAFGENISSNTSTSNDNRRVQDKEKGFSKGIGNVSSASTLVSNTDQKKPNCAYCQGEHYSDECKKYPDSYSRRQLVQDRCFNCLMRGHRAQKCNRKAPCVYCKKTGHHRSLCYAQFGASPQKHEVKEKETGLTIDAQAVNVSVNAQVSSSNCKRTIMQTAKTTIINEKNQCIANARLLFDTAGSRSFITEKKSKKLQLSVVGHELVSVSGFQSTKRITSEFKIVEFLVKCLDGSLQRVSASVVPTITCPIQKVPLDTKKFPILNEISLAEPLIAKSEFVEIDILIGLDYYYNFVNTERIQCPEDLILLDSRVGYITTGRVTTESTGPETIAVMLLNGRAQSETGFSSAFNLEKYWDLEDVGIKDPPKQLDGDEEALMLHSKSLSRTDDGRYVSKWPWKCENPDLPDNFQLAFGRLKSLLKRFADNQEVSKAYQKTTDDQLDKGVVEIALEKPSGHTVYYIPHHCVLTPSKTTTKLYVSRSVSI